MPEPVRQMGNSSSLSYHIPGKITGPSAKTHVILQSNLRLCCLCGSVQGHCGAMEELFPFSFTVWPFIYPVKNSFQKHKSPHQVPHLVVLIRVWKRAFLFVLVTSDGSNCGSDFQENDQTTQPGSWCRAKAAKYVINPGSARGVGNCTHPALAGQLGVQGNRLVPHQSC